MYRVKHIVEYSVSKERHAKTILLSENSHSSKQHHLKYLLESYVITDMFTSFARIRELNRQVILASALVHYYCDYKTRHCDVAP